MPLPSSPINLWTAPGGGSGSGVCRTACQAVAHRKENVLLINTKGIILFADPSAEVSAYPIPFASMAGSHGWCHGLHALYGSVVCPVISISGTLFL